jgi:predicted GIY-YIG superfamily endonuclease
MQKRPTCLRQALAGSAILLISCGASARFNVVVQASHLLSACSMALDKRVVYVMKNSDDSPRFYVGLTSDVTARVEDHNAGRCPHTARQRSIPHGVSIFLVRLAWQHSCHVVLGYDSAVLVGPAHGATDRRCVTASENHCEEQRDHGNRYSAHGTHVT